MRRRGGRQTGDRASGLASPHRVLQLGPYRSEGAIFRRVIGYSLILTSLVGVVAMIEAYVIPGIIPSP